MTRLLINETTIGSQPTGLGIYSIRCISALKQRFNAARLSSSPDADVSVPPGLAINDSKLAAIKRFAWLNTKRIGDEFLLYSPTHHGCLLAKRQIITVHDLIPLHHPKQHPKQHKYFRYFLPVLLSRCEAVFTVSEATKADLLRHYSLSDDIIHVVPNGVEASQFKRSTERTINDQYLLMVGCRYPHKNAEEVLRVNKFWKGKYKLVIASVGNSEKLRLSQIINELNLTNDVELLDYISTEHLSSLYEHASALIYPSKTEGFGIPPLEAFTFGTPVIASNIAPHREVLSDAAIFVDLGNQESWRLCFDSLTSHSTIDSRKKRIEASNYWSWDRSARMLIDSLLSIDKSLS